MIPCLSQAATLSTPFEADIPAYARAGWTAVEIWLTKLETFLATHAIVAAERLFDAEGVRPLAASFQGGLLLSRPPERAAHWDHFRRRLEWLNRLGVPTLVVAADFREALNNEDFGTAADALARAGALAGEFGVEIALEFQKANTFCASLDTTLALIAQSGAKHVGVCLDVFHYYCGPSKFEDLAGLTAETLRWCQLSDLGGVPREVARDSDRILPGEGDFQLGPILEHLERIGYGGGVSLEVLNPTLWQAPPELVANAAMRALRRTLDAARPARPIEGGP